MTAEEKKMMYYVSISGMQKAVRFGLTDAAVRLARTAHALEPFRLSRRLWTVLLEDCALDTDALLAFYRLRGSYKEWESLEPLVVVMANGQKTHAVSVASWVLKIPEIAMDTEKLLVDSGCAELLDRRKIWMSEEGLDRLNGYRETEIELNDGLADVIMTVTERALSNDYECQSVMLPWFFMRGRYVKPTAWVNEVKNRELFDGWFPEAAIDEHVWPGKMALAALRKRVEPPKVMETGKTDLWLEWIVFTQEGWRHDREIVLPRDYAKIALIAMGYGWLFDPSIEPWFDAVAPKLKELRVWSMKKYESAFVQLKNAVFETREKQLELFA